MSAIVSPGTNPTRRRSTVGSAILPVGPGVACKVTTHSKSSFASDCPPRAKIAPRAAGRMTERVVISCAADEFFFALSTWSEYSRTTNAANIATMTTAAIVIRRYGRGPRLVRAAPGL